MLSIQSASLTFGLRPILDDASIVIERGDRIGLLGRNGEGKSTLLKVITGEQSLDSGDIHRLPGIRISRLEQEITVADGMTIIDIVLDGLGEKGRLIHEYHLRAREASSGDSIALAKLDQIQKAVDAADAWSIDQKAHNIITRMGLDPDADYSSLSGGMKRRVLLARALANEPELLLLDEPTNHLDLDAITWMEEFLSRYQGTLVFITHDRRFLRKLATRIVELDRGRMYDWACNYDTFLERKQALLDAEDVANAKFDKRLAEEEVWIRKGIKARRTRNEGRVRALKEMREERRARLGKMGTADIRIQEGKSSGTLVAEAKGVHFSYDGNDVIKNLNTVIHRGDRVGVIGPNGAGKSTLIKLLLGEVSPKTGTIRIGTNLQISYFDQYRAALDETKTVMDNVSEGRDTVTIGGRDKHILSYLQDFLFTPERARSPVTVLSGGERNRLLLAKLFTRPSNLLVLDEPTNDLDIETLELLEEVVSEYTGTLIIVSHDRTFINNTVTQCLVLKGDGSVHEFVGDYDDWLRFDESQKRSVEAKAANKVDLKSNPSPSKADRQRKMSHKEQKELESMPALIEQLESEHARHLEVMSSPDFYRKKPGEIRQAQTDAQALEDKIRQTYERWEELESMATSIQT
jgi:ABC transport system ATP-binding/permease protein